MTTQDIMVDGFKKLIVYQKAFELSTLIVRRTRSFPKELTYDLGAQMRRAAISIPSNISEGYRRLSRKEFIQFLSVAYGSCGELQSQTEIASNQHLIPDPELARIQNLELEISRMLWAMIDRLRGKCVKKTRGVRIKREGEWTRMRVDEYVSGRVDKG